VRQGWRTIWRSAQLIIIYLLLTIFRWPRFDLFTLTIRWFSPWPNYITPLLDFIIMALPSVLILIIAHQISNDSLCCSNRYIWCFICRFTDNLYILLLTFLTFLLEIDLCIILHEIFWIKWLWNPAQNVKNAQTCCQPIVWNAQILMVWTSVLIRQV